MSPTPLELKIIDVRSQRSGPRNPNFDFTTFLNTLVDKLGDKQSAEHTVVDEEQRQQYTLKQGFDAYTYIQHLVQRAKTEGDVTITLNTAHIMPVSPAPPPDVYNEGKFL